uniref:Uncharacterized protein n=1 Tax=Zea mays TaxID=4577 RepID=A0A804MKP5_MAIZE
MIRNLWKSPVKRSLEISHLLPLPNSLLPHVSFSPQAAASLPFRGAPGQCRSDGHSKPVPFSFGRPCSSRELTQATASSNRTAPALLPQPRLALSSLLDLLRARPSGVRFNRYCVYRVRESCQLPLGLGLGAPSLYDGSAVLVSHTQWPRDFSSHLVVEGLLIAVIVFQLSRKSYKPPKKPLTEKEIDELCDEWEPELLCPPIKEGATIDAPTLESAVGPHTIVDC